MASSFTLNLGIQQSALGAALGGARVSPSGDGVPSRATRQPSNASFLCWPRHALFVGGKGSVF